MKKKILLLSAFILSGLSSMGQQGSCGTDAYNQKLFEMYPEMEASIRETDERISRGEFSGLDRDADYWIPVVFHILHDGETGNISDEQCQSAIDQLNEDFNALNPDFSNTRNTATAPFAPIAADYHITYGLAKKDPDGNCTNGIERRDVGANSYNADNGIKTFAGGGLDQWPRNQYLNIWVVNTIDSDGASGTILGYAQFPDAWGGSASTYGIVIRGDKVGTIGTADGDRTLTHEIGHCLGLYHTFQDGCHSGDCGSNGDRCCDTPPQDEATWSCSPTQNTCGIPSGDAFGIDAVDQFENFMSYSPCQYMFSMDQRDRTYSKFSSISWMANLTSLANANDKEILTAGPLCLAQFTSSETVICAGSTVTYDDNSYHNVTGRTWTFEGGTPSTSTAEIPTITYSTPGIYDVTLQVTDGSGTITTVESNHVVVLGDPGMSLPYSEGFETISALPDNQTMLLENDDEGNQFQLYTGAASSGVKCARLSNFGITNGSKDALVSGPIDLSGVDPTDEIAFSFKYAYKRRSGSNDEYLKIFISKDCGETWVLRKQIHGDDLGPLVSSSSYIPTGSNDWFQVDITNITSAYFVSNFRYKIEFTNDAGNNMFIDDINIYNATTAGISEVSALSSWSVYPNPVNNELQINVDGIVGADYQVAIYNVIGEKIADVYTGYLNAGMNTLNFDASNLPKGVYIIKVNTNGHLESKKIIKQ